MCALCCENVTIKKTAKTNKYFKTKKTRKLKKLKIPGKSNKDHTKGWKNENQSTYGEVTGKNTVAPSSRHDVIYEHK